MNNYYQPSGRFSPLAFVYFLGMAFIGIPLAALIYSFATWYIPFIYANVLLTVGFGLALGWMLKRAVIGPGKVRNTLIAMLIAVLGSLFAVYCQWVIWLDMVLNAHGHLGSEHAGVAISTVSPGQLLTLFFNPTALTELMREVNKVGTWGIRNATVSGAFLGCIWVIEALIICIIPLLVVTARSREPFCEISQSWFKQRVLPAIQYVEDANALVSLLERNDSAVHEQFQKTEALTDKHSILTLYYASSDTYYLSVTNKVPKYDSKGELSFKDYCVVPPISIDGTMGRKLVDDYNQHLRATQEA